MIKALLKKQMLESFSWIYFNRKNGKRRDAKGILFYVLLYLFVFGALGYMFYMMAASLGEPLCEMGLGWLYFAIVGLVAIIFGVFGSVFNTYASLYQAKLRLHLFLTLPSVAVLTVCVLLVLMPSAEYMILIPCVVLLFALFMAMFGWLKKRDAEIFSRLS